MSDILTQTVFWLALGGLLLSMMGIAALFQSERERVRLSKRLERATGTGSFSRTTSAPQRQGGSLAYHLGKLRRVVARMGESVSVVLGGEASDAAADLSSAGYRGRDALLIYAFLKTVVPLVAVVAGVIWVLMTKPLGIAMVMPGAGVIAVALTLSKGVDFFVDQRRKERLGRIRRSFPDLLELLVISSEAGLGPQPALHRVAAELATNSPELAQEILQMVSEMQMTNDRRAAYEKLGVRVPLPEIGVFTQTLDQSDIYGTPFSRAMRTLIDEQRANRLMAVEEKAARLPVLMTLPLIFCIMPAVFVVLVGPAALSVIDNILNGG
ncbi:type II secretion system F family protein [Sulfitobacter guttiformis]|uniref:Tight adherence protein C n=1 Tax=Sulfitobacter guttiformis TaxID=74349 RepID=A0A420DK56_9RHOB|nr:type II secretion system F family protein [Sulfitobacter guttiformis]KIN71543.1 Type II secretion system protein [Sulfitobacter guttiformis KCTC 32187]RKE94620.1 tight adherence protein C [Sulfitobacter guttiformis]